MPQEGKDSPSSAGLDHVTVMLCTFNGERFLAQQLDSIADQTHSRWSVVVSDDGSSDATLDILRSYQARWGVEKLKILDGPRNGFAQNFMSIVCDLADTSDYYSWADQDDIWHEEKIAKALEWIKTVPDHVPALYCGRTETITASGESVGKSPLFKRPPSFNNSLVQSLAGGNTMVFNRAAQQVLKNIGRSFPIVSHDWWAYLVICGVGGIVHYDERPFVCYRQHGSNLVGSNSDLYSRLKRLGMMFSGRFQEWNQNNITALESMQSLLTTSNRSILNDFKRARNGSIAKRFLNLKRSGVYRQTKLGGCALMLAVLCNAI
ncbi:glycosyltransferase family 2 protein [Pseudomonas sp. B21-040]|uniref:glycosyltransferase family 2 protein n=1 Tax=Pseudomonas sp. B21-040 TaxID=2895486 RepID=UPI00215E743A|nr:glycosyltransferase family 2 protein [Pseudomonas sp. B21-040]UVL38920.1 glycosyltransferase family 2 protein [Pseudomonas sp. B21-040]